MPWKISRVPEYAHCNFPQNFKWAFVPIDPVNMGTKFELRSFTRSWDNKGYLKTFGSPWILSRSLNSKIWLDPENVPTKFEVRSFTRSWDNSDWIFGWGLRIPNLGEKEALGGQGWYHYGSKERWRIPIGPPGSIVTFPISLRVSEILPLLCSNTPLFSPHLQSLSNFPMFPWE